VTTTDTAPVVAQRLRRGCCGSAGGAQPLVGDALTSVCAMSSGRVGHVGFISRTDLKPRTTGALSGS